MKQIRVLILGATGMLGHVLYRGLSKNPELLVYATARNPEGAVQCFPDDLRDNIITGVDAMNSDGLVRPLKTVNPDVVINCIGLIKQLPEGKEPLPAISINAQLPHRISELCRSANARMIHISTDCVFDGEKGNYVESDTPNATDLYGRTKFLGEVTAPNHITLRTSIIGHELKTRFGLVEWFLSQNTTTRGFTKAIFSGFPTIELTKIIADYVIPNSELNGLYHVSSAPINKYDLLQLIARCYEKKIQIEPSDTLVIDRSLKSEAFRAQTGYAPPKWEELVENMHTDFQSHRGYYHATA